MSLGLLDATTVEALEGERMANAAKVKHVGRRIGPIEAIMVGIAMAKVGGAPKGVKRKSVVAAIEGCCENVTEAGVNRFLADAKSGAVESRMRAFTDLAGDTSSNDPDDYAQELAVAASKLYDDVEKEPGFNAVGFDWMTIFSFLVGLFTYLSENCKQLR